MKLNKIFYLVLILLNFSVYTMAAPKDSLAAQEGDYIFAKIERNDGSVISCYVEYHDYFPEQISMSKYKTLAYSFNPKMPYKSRLHLALNEVKSMSVGYDKYLRILSDSNKKGILAKVISADYGMYRYAFDDYRDIKVKDSSYTTGLGMSLTHYDFCILNYHNLFSFYDINQLQLQVDKDLLSEEVTYLFNAEEFKIQLYLSTSKQAEAKQFLDKHKLNWAYIQQYLLWLAQTKSKE